MIRLGYTSSGLREFSFAQKLQLCKELDLPVIEVNNRDFPPDDDGYALRDLAAQLGVQVTSMGLAGMNLTDPAKREQSGELLDRALALAGGVGIGYVFSRVLPPPPNIPQRDTWSYCVGFTREVLARVADRGLLFGIESDPGMFVGNLERVERLVHEVNHPNLRVNFDPTNYYVVGSDPLVVIERLGHLFVNGHLKDGVYREGEKGERPIGQGEVPYDDIFARLEAHGLAISMHIEHIRTPDDVIQGVRCIRSVLARSVGVRG